MHVAPASRVRAFRKLVTLLKPGGVIALTLRDGPADAGRGCHPVSSAEIESLARQHGAFVERSQSAADQLGREDVRWTQMAVRLPDDGTGALPLLRHVVLNDDKSSTYKLGLLRALYRIADGAAGLARDHGDDHVAIPMGLVALTWIRLYKPLLASALPQSPRNRGYENLGFAKAAFRSLDAFSAQDLRIGMRCTGATAAGLHEAIRDVTSTIVKMPATYITYPGGNPVFPVRRTGRLFCPTDVLLDGPHLEVFGEMLVPAHLWRALQRFSCWIEPALIAEWIRRVKYYAERQGRALEEASLAVAMTWPEPTRGARIAREQALRLFQAGHLHCV